MEEEMKSSLCMLRRIEIRQEALDIQVKLMDSDINVVSGAERDLEQLLDRFYDENQDMIAPQQYDAAHKDFGYFLEDRGRDRGRSFRAFLDWLG